MGLSAQDVLIGAAPAGSAPGPVDCPTVALPVPWLLAFSNQGHALRVFLMGFCMLRGRSLMLHRRWLCASAVAGVSWDGAFFFVTLGDHDRFFGGSEQVESYERPVFQIPADLTWWLPVGGFLAVIHGEATAGSGMCRDCFYFFLY